MPLTTIPLFAQEGFTLSVSVTVEVTTSQDIFRCKEREKDRKRTDVQKAREKASGESEQALRKTFSCTLLSTAPAEPTFYSGTMGL